MTNLLNMVYQPCASSLGRHKHHMYLAPLGNINIMRTAHKNNMSLRRSNRVRRRSPEFDDDATVYDRHDTPVTLTYPIEPVYSNDGMRAGRLYPVRRQTGGLRPMMQESINVARSAARAGGGVKRSSVQTRYGVGDEDESRFSGGYHDEGLSPSFGDARRRTASSRGGDMDYLEYEQEYPPAPEEDFRRQPRWRQTPRVPTGRQTPDPAKALGELRRVSARVASENIGMRRSASSSISRY